MYLPPENMQLNIKCFSCVHVCFAEGMPTWTMQKSVKCEWKIFQFVHTFFNIFFSSKALADVVFSSFPIVDWVNRSRILLSLPKICICSKVMIWSENCLQLVKWSFHISILVFLWVGPYYSFKPRFGLLMIKFSFKYRASCFIMVRTILPFLF